MEEESRQYIYTIVKAAEPKNASLTGRAWKFLNSSFAIFVLGSIILSGITYLYANYQSRIAARDKKKDSMARISNEIDNRVQRCYSAFLSDTVYVYADTSEKYSVDMNRIDYDLLFIFLDDRNANGTISSYPEFKNVNFKTLHNELATLSDDPNVMEDLVAAYQAYNSFRKLDVTYPIGVFNDPQFRSHVKQVDSVFRNGLLRQTWKGTFNKLAQLAGN